jgi:hypothetical protein
MKLAVLIFILYSYTALFTSSKETVYFQITRSLICLNVLGETRNTFGLEGTGPKT